MSFEVQNRLGRVDITAFFGKTKHQVEKALEMFAASHTVIRTSYEYKSDRPTDRQHAIWVIYRKEI